jgi:electron-transferring-flavoprotein dehydrogenase
MEVDVLFVGGGVACLSGALHLANLIKSNNENPDLSGAGRQLDDITIMLVEKGAYLGAHSISGAVMDPVALRELVPDYLERGAPLEGEVRSEDILFLTRNKKIKAPFTPPMLNNHGNYVVSISKLTQWMAERVEEGGVDIFPGFAATEVLYEGEKVTGIRTGDKGIDKNGNKKSTYGAGIDLKAKVTVFGDGSRGNLTKDLIPKFHLDRGKNPQGYVVGVKEVWQTPDERIAPGHVIHTVGYPHKSETYGGGFIYGMTDRHISIGLMTGLEYKDPALDPHREFQKLKLHPYVADILREGKIVEYGAKTAPVGGYFSVPKLCFEGGLIVGDAANLFISQKIKGIHVAMKSGMLAAEAIFDALLKEDYSLSRLGSYERSLYCSSIGRELYRSRNFHQAFKKGLWGGMVKSGIQYLLGGRIIKAKLSSEPDFALMRKLLDQYGTISPTPHEMGDMDYDGKYTLSKDADLYYSGTSHEEQQPSHLKIGDLGICYGRCKEEYGNPCVRFCPANVYEIKADDETGKPSLKLNASNCLHCKTCDIKDPYGNINWVPPEGEGGPKYTLA